MATRERNIFEIEQIARLPRHLKQYIVSQEYDRYTPIDQAVWRYIMRQAFAFHKEHAHGAYVDGLRRTGISIDHIPRIEEMNEILGRIGWGAAPVDGFIPPAAFMEFQAHRVLVIAADIRQIDHLEYTPAPDIVHEAAGHAPIIADPEYAEYLRRFGEVGSKALSSRQDFELYEAIRHLSIVKEAPGTPEQEIAAAQRDVEQKQANLGEPSEMALLSRLHWWTVEYGLIGKLDHPKLYGAGLLSSIGEAAYCLTDAVRKLPYSVEAADVPFDITRMQPQLFVTPEFGQLGEVLEQFADTMAFRRGGRDALRKGMDTGGVCTFEYSSGLQVSGVLDEIIEADGRAIYVRTKGPTSLAFDGHELPAHGKAAHAEGFGAVVGRPIGFPIPLEKMDEAQCREHGLVAGSEAQLAFSGGTLVNGRLERMLRQEGRLLLLSFSGCRVTQGERVLFHPDWGSYDMAVGDGVVSVFHGAADQDAYEQTAFVPRERTVKVTVRDEDRPLHALYRRVREIRELGNGLGELAGIRKTVKEQYPGDWLLNLEIVELLQERGAEPALADEIRGDLERMARESADSGKLIRQGLDLGGRT